MDDYIEVFCTEKECLFYRPRPRLGRKCRCVHPEKSRYIDAVKCPLFRIDWQKQAATTPLPKKPKPR